MTTAKNAANMTRNQTIQGANVFIVSAPSQRFYTSSLCTSAQLGWAGAYLVKQRIRKRNLCMTIRYIETSPGKEALFALFNTTGWNGTHITERPDDAPGMQIYLRAVPPHEAT